MPRLAVLVASFALSMSAEARAENWSEFRGPTGQGISDATALPTRWSATENVRWKADVPGNGWSSPVVWGNRVFLTTALPVEGGDHSLRAMCLDADSGEQLWDVELFRQDAASVEDNVHPKNSHASPTPITDGEHLFVHFGAQGTACLTTDGGIVWRTRELKYAPRHGGGGSPVLVDDLLVVSCDGLDVQFIAALDRQTGEIRWKQDRPKFGDSNPFSFSTPLVIEADGRKQIISPASDKVVAYDPKDGGEIWQVRYVGYSIVPRPVYANGLVYFSTSFNNPVVYAVRPDGRGDVTDTHVAWTFDRAAPNTPSLLAVGKELYVVSDSGIATCLDAATGDRHWQKRLGGNFSASPVYGDGMIYFQSEDGKTVVVKTGTAFEEVARNDIGGRTLASPAVVGSDLLIRSDKGLYRVTAE